MLILLTEFLVCCRLLRVLTYPLPLCVPQVSTGLGLGASVIAVLSLPLLSRGFSLRVFRSRRARAWGFSGSRHCLSIAHCMRLLGSALLCPWTVRVRVLLGCSVLVSCIGCLSDRPLGLRSLFFITCFDLIRPEHWRRSRQPRPTDTLLPERTETTARLTSSSIG